MDWRKGVFLFLAGAGCASWDEVRVSVVERVNSLLHQEYPRALENMDLDRFAELHVAARREEARQAAGLLLKEFVKVEHGECIITRATPADAGGVIEASVLLRLDGLDLEGKRRTLVEARRIECAGRDGAWQIIADEGLGARRWQARGPTFVEEAVERGLSFTPTSRGITDRDGVLRRYLGGSGLAVRDVDNDGFEDLLLVGGGDLRLFRNLGGVFRDESEVRGIAAPPAGECRNAVFADIDNDGDGDLFVGVLEGENFLYLNDGSGRFRQGAAREAGIPSSGETTGACFGDFDGDGDLDLFIANGATLLRKEPEPIYDARNGTPDQFFLNRGDGTFEDATERAGVGDPGWALATAASDYDGDGDLDLVLANDFGLSRLYRNRGDATFDEVSRQAGIVQHGSSMGASFGDVDGNGTPDLFFSGMASNSAWILDQPGFPVPAPWPLRFLFGRQVLELMKEMLGGNRLYLNRGDGTFTEVAGAAGCANAGWAWGGVLLDYDNDGRLDMYVLNGLLSGPDKHDL